MLIDLQLNQGSAPWPLLHEAAVVAEETGFDTLWNLDHFSGLNFGSDSMLECFTTLTAWAGATSRINLGTLVTNVMNREPGLLANIVSSVQHVSGNRLILGIGAGTSPNSRWNGEQRALGLPLLPTMAQRHERLREVVGIMRGIWSHDRHESFDGFPRPDVEPRIIVGTNSAALARIAGQIGNGVNTRFDHPQRASLLAEAADAHEGGGDFDVTVWSWFEPEYADADHPFHRELVSEGVTRLVMFHRDAPDLARIRSVSRYLG